MARMNAPSLVTLPPWPETRSQLQTYLTLLRAPEAQQSLSPNLLKQMSTALAHAAEWARAAAADPEGKLAEPLAEYRGLLNQLQSSLTRFGSDLVTYREHLRSEAGHMRAAEAWVQRSRQVKLP
jgi:hypothetical protein